MTDHTTVEAQLLKRLDEMRELLIEFRSYDDCFTGSASRNHEDCVIVSASRDERCELCKRIDAALVQDVETIEMFLQRRGSSI